MSLQRALSNLLVVAFVTTVPLGSAQSDRSAAASRQQTIDLLLVRENEALDRYQRHVAPTIRCDYADGGVRKSCDDMLTKTRDDAQQAMQRIAMYRAAGTRQPADLFDIYVDSQSVLQDITILGLLDECWGNRNREALAQGYNSFIKLTGVWFPGEMRETIRDSAQQSLVAGTG
jgi:hypothetical protein